MRKGGILLSVVDVLACVELGACSILKSPFQQPEVSIPAAYRTEPAQASGSLSPDWCRSTPAFLNRRRRRTPRV